MKPKQYYIAFLGCCLVACTVLLGGCAAYMSGMFDKGKQPVVLVPEPPYPPGARELAEAARTAAPPPKAIEGASTLFPAPGKTITLSWCHPDTNVIFRIYHSSTPSLSTMTPLTYTESQSITLIADQPVEFFAVKAVNAQGMESDWAGGGECP